MNRYFLSLAFLVTTFFTNAQVTNQRLFDTVPFLPDHYAKRVARFESEKIDPASIVFLGNSITEGGNWTELTGDSTAVNRGIGGDITFGVLKRLDQLVSSKPSKLFLLIGINDIGKDIPEAVIADNIRKIIHRFKNESPKTLIYVQSLLPVNPGIKGFPQHYDKNDHVKKANALIQAVASSQRVNFIDTFKLFADSNGLLKEQFSPDGLHLNAQGYLLWAKHLKAINAL